VKTPARSSPRIRPSVASQPRRSQAVRVIATEADIATGIKALRRKCDVIRRLHDEAGAPPLRRRPPGLEGLARIVIGQQVSVASAAAIWARFEAVVGTMTAVRVLAMTDEDFREGGLSRPKIATMRAVATAMAGGLDLEALALAPVDDAHAALTAVKGIGPWTADVYLMFCAGHVDVFAAGDLALQEAAKLAFKLDARPSADALAALAAARWSPWRAVAARMLWHHYAWTKAQATADPV
jgi:DNA-3-methyladenine glycosylase II